MVVFSFFNQPLKAPVSSTKKPLNESTSGFFVVDSGSSILFCDSLSDVYPVSIWVGKHKCPQAVIFILKPFRDPGSCPLTERKQSRSVINQQVRYREISRLMLRLQRQMEFTSPLFDDNKPNRIAILKRLAKP